MTPQRKRIIAAIVAAFYLAGILLAVEATMKVRTPQGAIAWSVSLVSFPFVAVPAYLVLGRSKFEGMAEAFESRRDEFERLLVDIQKKLDPWEIPPGDGPSWHAAMTRLSGCNSPGGTASICSSTARQPSTAFSPVSPRLKITFCSSSTCSTTTVLADGLRMH